VYLRERLGQAFAVQLDGRDNEDIDHATPRKDPPLLDSSRRAPSNAGLLYNITVRPGTGVA
jgi:hypothetical protein